MPSMLLTPRARRLTRPGFVPLVALLVAMAGLAGCSSDQADDAAPKEGSFFERLRGDKPMSDKEKREEQRLAKLEKERDARGAPRTPDEPLAYYQGDKSSGPKSAIKVTWQALARERALYENSAHRRPQGGLAPQMEITLMSENHPDAAIAKHPRSAADRERFAQTAVMSDGDLRALVVGLRKQGFFQHAQDTGAQRGAWNGPSMRGRVTVEQDGRSVTVLSARGQGMNESTRAIPALYSQAKQAIMLMRNSTPTLNLSVVDRGTASMPLGR